MTMRRRIRSFVRRDGRMTLAQSEAFERLWPLYGLELNDGEIAYEKIFQRVAPCILEIGFGSGYSLLAMAENKPDHNYIGIETHRPGIGTLLFNIETHATNNIRLYYADAVDVLTHCIPNQSLDGVQLFFPDPWPKRRHHKRRLIQPAFVKMLALKLKTGGALHLATDWQDYAAYMMKVLSQTENFINAAGKGQFAERSLNRPLVTKFEQRGEKEGRPIWELQFFLDFSRVQY